MVLNAQQFKGIYTAIPSPVTADGNADVEATARLVDFLCNEGVDGVVPVGGTGEYAALSHEDRVAIVRACVEAAAGRCHVVAGVLDTGMKQALASGRAFMDAGAQNLMLVTPYYATGPQEGLRAYFARYAEAMGFPVVLYEIPRRTGVSLTAQTITGIVDDGSIIGMKCCNEDMAQFTAVIQSVGRRISVLCGEEPLLPAHAALGATGGVLATSSIYPRRWKRIYKHFHDGNITEGLREHAELSRFLKVAFCEPNPGPLKAAMALAGMPVGEVLLPLLPPGTEVRESLREAMHALE